MNDISIPIYLNLQIENLEGEEWKDITGYDGFYLISNLGRVKSYQREIDNGVKGVKIQPERIMKQTISLSSFKNIKEPSKSLKIKFCINYESKAFHVPTLVGNAFVGQLKYNQVYSKKDKVWYNNKADNLIILSKSEDIKLSYEKGNNLRKKKCLNYNHEAKYVYKREIDGITFIGGKGLKIEYKKDVRSNIEKGILKNTVAYGSKWSKEHVLINSNQ